MGPKSPSGLIVNGMSCMLEWSRSPLICSLVIVMPDEESVRAVMMPMPRDKFLVQYAWYTDQ